MQKKLIKSLAALLIVSIPIIPVAAKIHPKPFIKVSNINSYGHMAKKNINFIREKYEKLGYKLKERVPAEYIGTTCKKIGYMIFIHSGRKPLVVIEPFKENLEDVSENFNTKNIQIKSDFEISMENAFENCYNFNQNISYWDVSKVTNMSSMFKNARKFNQSLYYWDVSKVTDMSSMFEGAALFNDNDIRWWKTGNVRNMASMFENAKSFNRSLYYWDVSGVIDMSSMFKNAISFNSDISSWNVSRVINMSSMFEGALEFNITINKWNFLNVTNMSSMFKNAKMFDSGKTWEDGDLDKIGPTFKNVVDMSSMFEGAEKFNRDISKWDISNVKNMSSMFKNAKEFNNQWRELNEWLNRENNICDMSSMFEGALVFDRYIKDWNTSKVENMTKMFKNAKMFDKDISTWKVNNVKFHDDFCAECPLAFERFPQNLIKDINNAIANTIFDKKIDRTLTFNNNFYEKVKEIILEKNLGIDWNDLIIEIKSINENKNVFISIKPSAKGVWKYTGESIVKIEFKENINEKIKDINLGKLTNIEIKNLEKITNDFILNQLNVDKINYQYEHQTNNKKIILNFNSNENYEDSVLDIKYEIKKHLSELITDSNFSKVKKIEVNEIQKVIKEKCPKIDFTHFDIEITGNKVIIKAKDSHPDYQGEMEFNIEEKLDISKLITDSNFNKVAKIEVEEIKRVIREKYSTINFDYFEFQISNNKVIIKTKDSHPDYQGELQFSVEEKLDVSKLITDSNFSKVKKIEVTEIQKVIKEKCPKIDFTHFDIEITGNKVIIKAKDSHPDYQGEMEFNIEEKLDISKLITDSNFNKVAKQFSVEEKLDVSKLITDSNFSKVKKIEVTEIQKVIKEKCPKIDFAHFDIKIAGNKVIIKAKDSHPDYQGQKEIIIEVKKQISELITSENFDKVNIFDESSIKKVILVKHPTIDFNHLDLVISGNEIIIKAKDSHPDYQGQKEIVIEVKKQVSELITSPKFNKVAKIEVEEIKKVIREKYPEIDFAHFGIEITGNKVIIKAKDSHPDYQGQKEIIIEVKKQISELITSREFNKVAKINFEEIKRVIREKYPTINFDYLEFQISNNKVIIKTKDSHPDYQGEIEVAIAVKKQISELITSPKFNKVAKIEVEEIKKVIREKYPEIDFAHLDIEIKENKVIIKAKDSHPDYRGELQFNITEKINIAKMIDEKNILLELKKVKAEQVNEKGFKLLIEEIFHKLGMKNIEFDISLEKHNNRIVLDFNNDDNYHGKISLNYEIDNLIPNKKNNSIIWKVIIAVILSITLLIILILIIKKTKKGYNKQN
ncbi:BspA family leucine-rich repeat surface protein [Mycoplasma phocoeninasale]|uniref:BspA family leucine-rich repeat surface protein n=1 Tax=Mycoplasma phocoeninasale TaxID=2726117 RepID=UPI001968495D|nr:DUF285 domain-containing protein [Mycoplasma phocoeninasale]